MLYTYDTCHADNSIISWLLRHYIYSYLCSINLAFNLLDQNHKVNERMLVMIIVIMKAHLIILSEIMIFLLYNRSGLEYLPISRVY